MQKGKKSLIIIIVAAVILAITCPSKDKHVEVFARQIQAKAATELAGNPFAALANPMASGMISSSLSVDSYLLFSIGTFAPGFIDSEAHTASFGILGFVIPFYGVQE